MILLLGVVPWNWPLDTVVNHRIKIVFMVEPHQKCHA